MTEIKTFTDYCLFGMPMPGRQFNSEDYRYAFNGMEKDDEVKGAGNSYDFGARMYDSRLGRWFSIDPNVRNRSIESSYSFSSDNPIFYVDYGGETKYYYLIIHDERDGSSTKITIAQEEGMERNRTEIAMHGGGISEPRYFWYDTHETVTLNFSEAGEATISHSTGQVGSSKTTTIWDSESLAEFQIWIKGMDSEGGGFHFVTTGYAGGMETRKGDFRDPSVNIDDLMKVFELAGSNRGAGAGGLPAAKIFDKTSAGLEALEELAKTIQQQNGNINNVLDIIGAIKNEMHTNRSHETYMCEDCTNYMNGNNEIIINPTPEQKASADTIKVANHTKDPEQIITNSDDSD